MTFSNTYIPKSLENTITFQSRPIIAENMPDNMSKNRNADVTFRHFMCKYDVINKER